MNDKGKIEVKSRKGFYDDRVMSLALAVHGVDYPMQNITEEHNSYGENNQGYDKYAII
jgi:hypothetical protein